MTSSPRADGVPRDAWLSLCGISATVMLSSITHAYEFASAVPYAVGATIVAFLYLLHRLYSRGHLRWAFVLYGLLNLFIIGGPGIWNGLWNHAVKLAARAHHEGTLPPALEPLIVSPDLGIVYETVAVLTFVASMFAAWFGFRYARVIVRGARVGSGRGGGKWWIASLVLLLALLPTSSSAQEPTSLTLGDAARCAAERSATSEVARYRVGGAEARLRQQRAELLPTITAGLSLGASTMNSASFGLSPTDPGTGAGWFDPDGELLGPVRVRDARAEIRQTLVDLAAFGRVAAERAAVAAAVADADQASEMAAATAATLYIQALRADARLSARHADSALAEDLVGIALGQREAGMGIDLDVTRARAQVAATRAQLIEARTERERTRQGLRRALGMAADAPLLLTDSLLQMPMDHHVPGVADAIERALAARPELHAVDARVDIATRRLRAVRRERLPSLSFVADLGGTGPNTARMLRTYSWGLRVSVPLFDGLRREGRVAEQRSAVRELETLRRDLERQVVLEVRLAQLDLASAAEQLGASRQRLALAEQEQEQARRRFIQGVAGNADVITALLALNAARTELVDAHAIYQSARVALAVSQSAVTQLR